MLIGGAILGILVGALTGLFGAGGGFIVTPALNMFLGVPISVAVGTSACQVLGASTFSLFHRLDRKLMGIRTAIAAGVGIPPGTFLGARTVQRMKGRPPIALGGHFVDAETLILLCIFALFLMVIAGWLFYDNFVRRRNVSDDEHSHVGLLFGVRLPPLYRFRTIPAGRFSVSVLVLLGIFTGYLGGLLGIGGGVIMMPLLFYLVGQETKFATQTSTYLVFVSGAFATVFHAIDRNINYPLAIALVAGAYFGSRIGIAIQSRISGRSIRKYFGFVVVAAWLLVVVRLGGLLFVEQ